MTNEAKLADHLRTIPRSVPSRRDLLAWADADPETGLLPFYRQDGSLWFILDKDGNTVPLPPEPLAYGPDEPYYRYLHRRADESRTLAKCYFIGGTDGAIKIGFSVSVEARLATIRAHSPIPVGLLATAPGGEERERAYHEQFAAHRLHGEWFERCPEIMAEIARLTPMESI